MEVEWKEEEEEEEEVIRWERFLPRTVLRVLVVERDDSTRNVISALLRKCSYKVTSLSDGLEAWEALKEKPQSFDIILTEVELPSISGFTLLSLVMDHHNCNTIPVIMMSSQDSISTVLKCMLKGAADFLIKPIRKNELKNIWQHVWRRQISTAENNKSMSTKEECENVGATSGKTAVSSPSNGNISSKQEQAECKVMKITSDVEGEDPMDKRTTNNNLRVACVKIGKESGPHGIIGEEFGTEAPCSGTRNLAEPKVFEDDFTVKKAKLCDSDRPRLQGEEHNDGPSQLLGTLSLAAIDLIGSFGPGKGKCETSKCVVGNSNSACSPQLELTLHGSDPSDSKRNGANDTAGLLNHSTASAFSRYNSGSRIQHCSPSYSIDDSKAQNESKKPHKNCMQLQSAFNNRGDDCTAAMDEQVELTSASSFVLVPPIERSKNSIEVSVCPDPSPTPLDAHSCQTAAWSTCISRKAGSSELQKAIFADNINSESRIGNHVTKNKSVREDCIGSVAVTLGSSMCDTLNSSSSMCTEFNENILIRGRPSRADTIHTSEREAALIKFRQKRKERCFEKKVRYHSRKQLAEQRPRVKGQFVRHMQADSASSAS